jgi:hypothetical protein
VFNNGDAGPNDSLRVKRLLFDISLLSETRSMSRRYNDRMATTNVIFWDASDSGCQSCEIVCLCLGIAENVDECYDEVINAGFAWDAHDFCGLLLERQNELDVDACRAYTRECGSRRHGRRDHSHILI